MFANGKNTDSMSPRRIKVGIVANEFFDAKINRVGGFGWAARRAADAFRSDSRFETPVFFSGQPLRGAKLEVDGLSIIGPQHTWLQNYLRARREAVDILLCVDYRQSYLKWFRALPRTPAIVWVRDPRDRAAVRRLASLRIPGDDDALTGVSDFDFQSLKRFAERTDWLRRDMTLACKMQYMGQMIPEVFGLPDPQVVLPNPDVIDYSQPLPAKAEHPRVISVARLDPVKRPWLFVELARHFPGVEFIMLGKSFVDDELHWAPDRWPENLKRLGNVDGKMKLDLIASSWVLVNTAIHDESAVSNLEALACETPLISFIESDGLADRFGICLGYDSGDGFASMPKLRKALESMIGDHDMRSRLGRAGRDWVRGEHSTSEFLEKFLGIARVFNV